MTFCDIFSEINLDSSVIYVIILTNLIFLASKLGVPTLNIIWSFLHDRDIKDMSKIVTKQKYKQKKCIWILTEEKLCGNKQ